MKKIHVILLFQMVFLSAGYTQVIPKGMNYQAVARNLKGEVIANEKIAFKIYLFAYDGQQRINYYSEVHETTTNAIGYFNLTIGEGSREQGEYGLVPWNRDNIWMEVAIKDRGRSAFATVSSNRLMAVPYAIHAGTAERLTQQTETSAFSPPEPGVQSTFWSVLGNHNTDESGNLYHVNSLGTTDNVDLIMITDNVERLRILAGGDIVTKLNFEIGQNLKVGLNVIVPLSASIGDSLTVKKNVLLNTTGGETINNGPFTVDSMSPALLSGTLTVDLATDLNSILMVDGPTDLNDSLTVNQMSPTKFTGTLQVDSTTDLNDALFVNNMAPTALTGTLQVDKDATLLEKLIISSMHQTDTSGAMPTGALQVLGGTYINENLYIGGIAKFGGPVGFGGPVAITDLTQSTNTSTGALVVSGGVGIGLNLNVGGAAMIGGMTTIKDLTESIDSLTGALKIMGGAGIRKRLNVGGLVSLFNTLNVTGATTLDSLLNVSGNSSYVAQFTNTGNQNGISIQVNNAAPGIANNYVEFRNVSTGVVGRIEGENVNEYQNNETYKREIDKLDAAILGAVIAEGIAIASAGAAVFQLAGAIASATGCYGLGVMTCAPIISFIVKAALDVATFTVAIIAATSSILAATGSKSDYIAYKAARVGVTYESGSGDYAEWLPKADPSESFLPGYIVGVKNGQISKNLDGATQYMVISTRPIVLGNMPEKDVELNYEKVAFLGQVPVHVLGNAEIGDYILPSGNNDGMGRAVSAANMKIEDYLKIVGVAWSASGNQVYDLVQVAIGLNGGDISKVVMEQKNKIQELTEKFNKRNKILSELVPGFKEALGLDQMAVLSRSLPGQSPTTLDPLSPGGASAFDLSQFEVSRDQISDLLDQAEVQAAKQGIDLSSNSFFRRIKTDPAYKEQLLDETQRRMKSEIARQFEKLRPRN